MHNKIYEQMSNQPTIWNILRKVNDASTELWTEQYNDNKFASSSYNNQWACKYGLMEHGASCMSCYFIRSKLCKHLSYRR